jgi:thioredoxin 2
MGRASRMMASEFAKAPAESAGEAVVAKVNSEDPPQITSQFRIAGIPAFARTQNGKLTAQTSGFQSASQLEIPPLQ